MTFNVHHIFAVQNFPSSRFLLLCVSTENDKVQLEIFDKLVQTAENAIHIDQIVSKTMFFHEVNWGEIKLRESFCESFIL